MTVSCRDTDTIPKVPGAGGVFDQPSGARYQRMHNGVQVVAGGYHGEWMSEVIRRLQGHHEPQEEVLFDFALRNLQTGKQPPVMVELGSFWGYYSLWFRSMFPNARMVLVEPDPNSLEVGKQNFGLNGATGEFLWSSVGQHGAVVDFISESDSKKRPTVAISVDGLVHDLSLDYVDMLHADIQGAELDMLGGAAAAIDSGKVSWLFVSTHHHSISGDPLTHQRCLGWLVDRGAQIVEEHSVSESFSGDGLIVAHFGVRVRSWPPMISRNVPSRSLFRELEYDLDRAWKEISRLKSEAAAKGTAVRPSC